MYQLILQENLSEVISYQNPAFMIRAYRGDLFEYVNKKVPAHWHREVEFIFLEEGTAVYHVNEQRYVLHKGDGLLVNSNRLHYGYSPCNSNFVYSVLQFSPDFVDSRPIRQRFLNSLICDSCLDALLLTPEDNQQTQFLETLFALIQLNLEKGEDYELFTMELFYRLFRQLWEVEAIREQSTISGSGSQIPTLQNMLTYIQNHYAQSITLADIAASGAMCRSKCCNLFRKVLHQSPLEFTQNFRIQKSIRLLLDTDDSITEIAASCGFNKSSYYIECFHRIMGQSPGKYRKAMREQK